VEHMESSSNISSSSSSSSDESSGEEVAGDSSKNLNVFFILSIDYRPDLL